MRDKRIIVAFLIFLLISCRADRKEVNSPADVQSVPTQQKITKFALREDIGENRKWELEAETAEFIDKDLINLKSAKAKIYMEDGRIVDIVAQDVLVNKSKKTADFKGRVEATISRDNLKFVASCLDWDAAHGVVKTDGIIQITSESITISGRGLEVFLGQSIFKIKNSVKVSIERGFPISG